MQTSDLHERMARVVGDTTYRHLGELTGTHPETVRRYLQGQAPSAEFLINLCRAFGVSANWLLHGQGPMRASEIKREALRQADAAELLTAMSETMTVLIDRVSRLERYMQTLETRLRAAGETPMVQTRAEAGAAIEQRPPTNAHGTRARATRIAGAASERPPQDAD